MLSYFCLIRWSFVPAPYCPRKHRMLVLMNKISRQIAIRTIVAFVAMSVAVSEAGAADAHREVRGGGRGPTARRDAVHALGAEEGEGG